MDEVAPGVYVATAEIYVTTTTVVAGADGGCLVIDPAVTPDDLATLAGWLSARGLRPAAGWSTHPHWDHVLWSGSLGGDVVLSPLSPKKPRTSASIPTSTRSSNTRKRRRRRSGVSRLTLISAWRSPT